MGSVAGPSMTNAAATMANIMATRFAFCPSPAFYTPLDYISKANPQGSFAHRLILKTKYQGSTIKVHYLANMPDFPTYLRTPFSPKNPFFSPKNTYSYKKQLLLHAWCLVLGAWYMLLLPLLALIFCSLTHMLHLLG